jgi:hypothetical protein
MGRISFAIEHPDLSSSLVPPRGACRGEFQAITCVVDVKKPSKAPATVNTFHAKRGNSRKSWRLSKNDHTGHQVGLCSTDLDAVDQFVNSLGLSGAGRVGSPENEESPAEQRMSYEDLICSLSFKNLLQSAIEQLVFGGRRSWRGVRAVKREPHQGLVQLISPVFSIPYVRV